MGRRKSLARVFEFDNRRVHLTGFPESASEFLRGLEYLLNREPLFKRPRPMYGSKPPVGFTFDPKFIKDRQRFFRRTSQKDHLIKSRFFDSVTFPSYDKGNSKKVTQKEFLDFCQTTYEILDTARREMGYFGNFHETALILDKADSLDERIKAMLRTLHRIDKGHLFAVDSRTGSFALMEEMPEDVIETRRSRNLKKKLESSEGETPKDFDEFLFHKVKASYKKGAIEIAELLGVDFRREISDYVIREMKVDLEEENLRTGYERLALPLRMGRFYNQFLKQLENARMNPRSQDEEEFEENEEFEEFEEFDAPQERKEKNVTFAPSPIYPSFGDSYTIRNLFPPMLMSRNRVWKYPVPINFTSRPGERKFLIAGLHSGGKSFFLENIVLTSIIGQIGLSLSADEISLPAYENIFYYKNQDNGNGQGKLETELGGIEHILNQATDKDLVVIDEFLDSTTAEIANEMGKVVLGELKESGATVFVTSHRNTNYHQLAQEGWTIMTPDYEINEGKIRPIWKLKRGSPEEKINRQYIMEKYGTLFSRG